MFLEGKIAIVTAGGGPGIGRAVSGALANEGAVVVIAELDRARAEEAAAEIRDAGGTVLAVPTDVSLKSDVVHMVQRTVDEFGRGRHSLQPRRSGYRWPHRGHARGGLGCQPRRRSQGHVLVHPGCHPSHEAPQVGPHRQHGVASRLQADLRRPLRLRRGQGRHRRLLRAVAMEVGTHGITVNCIAPGHVSGSGMSLVIGQPMPTPEQEQHRIDTENQILEPRRMVTPQEIAGALLYLVGPHAERVTGTVMHVNGGSYLPA